MTVAQNSTRSAKRRGPGRPFPKGVRQDGTPRRPPLRRTTRTKLAREQRVAKRIAKSKARVLALLRKIRNLSAVCLRLRIPRQDVYDWRQADPEFDAAVDEARDTAIDNVEATTIELAQRKSAAYHKDRALVLKGYKRKTYGDKLIVGGDEEHPVRLEVVNRLRQLSPEDREAARRLAEKLEPGGS